MATELRSFDRLKGAEWFPILHKKQILVIGQGGIGSWLSLMLCRIGCELYAFDNDRFEKHNMSGQLVMNSGIGNMKSTAVREVLIQFCEAPRVYADTIYTQASPTGAITICAVDNMRTRRIAFEKWADVHKNNSGAFFQDGRLNAEQLQIFNIPGGREDLIKKYKEEYLFKDEEVPDADCTFKQTSHCAAMIASHMTGFLTNWSCQRVLPFFYEYLIPANFTNIIQ